MCWRHSYRSLRSPEDVKHIFIINPAAGLGKADHVILPKIQQVLADTDVDYEIHRSLSTAEIESYVRQRASEGDEIRFYAVGGDGTINNVLNGMAEFRNAQLAVVPCGTGDDFSRNFTHKENFLDIRKMMDGAAVKCDVMKMNDQYAINMFNIGVDCDIVVEAMKFKNKPFMGGSASYAISALKVLSKGGKYRMKYRIDGSEEIEEELLLVAIGNGAYCGGGFHSCPKADLNDGLLDVCVARPVPSFAKLLPLLMKYKAGKHIEDEKAQLYIDYIQCSEITLSSEDPVNVAADGEVSKLTEARFTCVKDAIDLVIPEGSELISGKPKQGEAEA